MVVASASTGLHVLDAAVVDGVHATIGVPQQHHVRATAFTLALVTASSATSPWASSSAGMSSSVAATSAATRGL